MRKSSFSLLCCLVALIGLAFSGTLHAQLSDVTQPGDPIVGTSNNTPGSEGVANAIDNQPTKYLNFDRLNTGFTVSPRVGLTIVQGLTLTSANDAPERDPATYRLEGSYDGTAFTLISQGTVPAFPTRFYKNTILFDNSVPYLHYRLIFPEVVGPGGNSMQISEVELLGTLAPTDVTQPGDPIVGTSNNTPGSEGVANAIDNQPTKYLNFDRLNTGFTVTPSVGGTLVSGITLTSANDAPERDPADYRLEGSLDGTTFFEIASGTVPAFPSRFYKNYIFFPNSRAFRTYRLIFPNVVGPGGNSMQISEVELLGVVADLPQDVTQPGDPIVGTSNNTPGSEGVANAIDNQPTKYLNFDRLNTGFTVSPRAGLTIVSGLTLTSANDAPERDPADYTLEGSYDGVSFALISSGTVPAFPTRFHKNTILFNNKVPYLHYRLIFPNVVGPGGNSMQIAEVELLGVLAPTDVTVPGDPIVGTSNNTPGSEGVANAIDNQPTKYLNFDRLNTGFTVTPSVGDTIVIGLTLTSANDAPERDPASYTLEGSNDGSTFAAISSGAVPAFPTRFYKNYIFFADNNKSYKSYRLIFPTVVGPGGNSMQISEVEFLGSTPGAVNTNPVSNLIVRQPVDTPALLGATATFRVGLSGPWRVQWYRNGVAIPGATSAAYTTAPVTTADDGALFHAVVQGRDGRQISDEVMLSVFTPSATESIGVSWRGGGANGAPTDMLPTDITGFHLQAYWNNMAGGSSNAATVVNSANQLHPTITVSWATSGEWGVGTGNSDATERMLNGMVTSFSTTESGAQTVTLSGVPSGNHSVLLYTVQVPQEFFNMDFAVVTHDAGGTDVVQRRYIRPQNSDEYNPSPGFSLVTAETPEDRGVGNMIRFDNVQPGSDGLIIIRFYSPGRIDLPGGDPIRGPGLNAMQLVLNAPSLGQPPAITRQPASANGIAGGCITLTVEATGPDLAYQWLKNGQTIAGATDSQLTLANINTNSAGNYTVIVSNPAGRVASRTAVVGVVASGQITSGLIAHFKLDELDPAGTGVANSAPGGQAGEWRGSGIVDIQDHIGTSPLFGGTESVYVPNYPKVSRAVTVAGWILPVGGPGPLVNNWVEGRTTGSSGQFFLDLVSENGATTLRSQIEVGPNRVQASGPVNDDPFEWHHFAMSANGVGLSIYWDGALISTVDYLGNINATAEIPWLAIGANLGIDGTQLGNGLVAFLDDIAMWNRSLSAAEIQGIYSSGLNLVGVASTPPVLTAGTCPPTITCPGSLTADCDTPVTYNVSATDQSGNAVPVTCTPATGSVFPVGSTTVTCTATVEGRSSTCSFRVTVRDSAPVVTCPANLEVQCVADVPAIPANAAEFVAAGGSVTDACNGALEYHASDVVTADSCGATIRRTHVFVDASSNVVSCVQTITARDTIAPQLACPANIEVAEGDPVNITPPTANDNCSGALASTCVRNDGQPLGSSYPLGTTTVSCTVADTCQNQAACSFTVTVIRVNDPPANCLATIVPPECALASSDGLRQLIVSLDGVSACAMLQGAAVDPEGLPLAYSWSIGGTPLGTGATIPVCLPVGCHIVTLTATDPAGAACSDTLEVCVITAAEAIEQCVAQVEAADLDRKNKRPFLASLKAASASAERGNLESGMNQLGAYRNKVRAQLGRTHPSVAQALLEKSQQIIDAILCSAENIEDSE